ncbi:3'(2'),5'-bisphosphate nucleotidase CysQ [Chromobacterium piscinae]|uniref:3'(2'),5'-bisphosphate nucleotidase CysQ n=1 Tax=Chromobacterium piscinae TaxID=686831 RepID=UPI001C8BB6A3|nr:3'(2'),5'-bisphosphate nucleotidase CysQ [Chromobacterium piscinae]MBX9298489.1 3'(2'),5'-bisphosphate nucleotidase CysQ [Chromobacterium vaccinii]MBX9358008.1 3'(2'),5'-bisphosphate nucleotidase CysQ [Chromobacterium vaccinii]MCD4504444.1 3'(2'),5'-bisphosphate nucleotidase CysQ [Chromobacterium piscinae]
MPEDHQLAAHAAAAAARLLLDLRRCPPEGGKALGARGDAESNALILELLRAARPNDGILSEESAPDPARLGERRVWIVDPLDGTREYCEPSRDDWAVHVALAVDGAPAASAVALPALGELFSTPAPLLAAAPEGRLKILVSRSRPPALAERVAARLDAELVPMGSAGAKAMAVLRGEAHAYLHAGGMNEWDTCAPVGVALAAGLHASRIDGSPCVFNQADVKMPDLLICRPELAETLLAAIAAEQAPDD